MKYVQINSFYNGSTGTIMKDLHKKLQAEGHDSYIFWGRRHETVSEHEQCCATNLGVYSHGIRARLTDRVGFYSKQDTARLLAKLDEKDAAAGDPAVILEAAVSGGARAMGLADCDAVAVGKKADLIVVDMHRANMRPVHNVVKNLVYSGNPGNVLLTMIAGKILYEKGAFFVGEDPDAVYRGAERLTAELMAEV